MENGKTNNMKIQTTEKTFNKKVKEQVIELMPNAKSFFKKHIAGIGYVFFIKNENKETIGKVWKEHMKGMLIVVN